MIEFKINEEYENVRIDRFLRKNLKVSLSEIYKLLRKGKIKINNKKISQDYRLQISDVLLVYLPEIFLQKKEESYLNISDERKKILESIIVYENENLFIINKPFGEIVHKGSGHDVSLLEEYRGYYKNLDVNFVNRIDKETSGLVIATKNIRTAREIATEIQKGNIEKKYYVLVHGKIFEKIFTIKNYLKKDEERVVVSDTEKEDYRISITHFENIKTIKDKYTLLEAKLETGRTHQIRAQLSHINHPIVGDKKYGINDKVERMHLFSYYLKLKSQVLEIKLEIPNFFIV